MRVNGKTATLGDSADPESDEIRVDGRVLRLEPLRYWLLHKPRGVLTSTSDPEGRTTVLALVPERSVRLYPVGRLDRDTEGLLLLTNDGEIAQALLHPSLGNEREYEVVVRGAVASETLDRLARGIRLDDGITAPATVTRVRRDAAAATTRFALTLREGRKRQIRRSLEALGHPVLRLLRVRMGPLRLGALAVGEARRLRPEEERALRAHATRLREAAAGSAGAGGRGRGDGRRGRGRAREHAAPDRLEQDEREPEAQQEEERAQRIRRHGTDPLQGACARAPLRVRVVKPAPQRPLRATPAHEARVAGVTRSERSVPTLGRPAPYHPHAGPGRRAPRGPTPRGEPDRSGSATRARRPEPARRQPAAPRASPPASRRRAA